MRSRRCRPAISFLRATRGPVSRSPAWLLVCLRLICATTARVFCLTPQRAFGPAVNHHFSVSQLLPPELQGCRRRLRLFRRSHSATSPRSLLRDHDVEAVSVPIRSCKHCQARFIPCGLTCSRRHRPSTEITFSAPARLAPLFIVGLVSVTLGTSWALVGLVVLPHVIRQRFFLAPLAALLVIPVTMSSQPISATITDKETETLLAVEIPTLDPLSSTIDRGVVGDRRCVDCEALPIFDNVQVIVSLLVMFEKRFPRVSCAVFYIDSLLHHGGARQVVSEVPLESRAPLDTTN